MRAPHVRRSARGSWLLVVVALVACVVLSGPTIGARPPFPSFIPMPNTPSGVAVDKSGNVYVSVREGADGVVWKYSPDGTPSFYAAIGEATVYGLAVTANGELYVAMAVGDDRGVYRVDAKGNKSLLPGSDAIFFPNGFAFDDSGTLYITESASAAGEGGVWRIPPGGDAEVWVRDPLLTGIGILGNPPAPIGANGIGYLHGDVYVTNTDKHLVLRIPVMKDGSAGEIETWKTLEEVPESPLAHSRLPLVPDGLAFDVHGNVYVTVLTRNAVVRIKALDQSQETVAVLGSTGAAPSALLDTPASLAFGTGGGEQQNLFVTNLGWMVRFVPALSWPGAALVKVPAGAPGRPLH